MVVIGWIYKANKFFYFHTTPYNQMLMLAYIHMEGKALVWYQSGYGYGRRFTELGDIYSCFVR
jgi:hypothetical protein